MTNKCVRAAASTSAVGEPERAPAEAARVRQICERATSRNWGAAVLAVRPWGDGGEVGVWLSSWPRADEARRQLEPAGYLVTEMDPSPAHGVGLVVVDGLRARLSEAELVEVEIAAGSLLADPTLRRLVPRLVAEARASRVSPARAVAALVSE